VFDLEFLMLGEILRAKRRQFQAIHAAILYPNDHIGAVCKFGGESTKHGVILSGFFRQRM